MALFAKDFLVVILRSILIHRPEHTVNLVRTYLQLPFEARTYRLETREITGLEFRETPAGLGVPVDRKLGAFQVAGKGRERWCLEEVLVFQYYRGHRPVGRGHRGHSWGSNFKGDGDGSRRLSVIVCSVILWSA